MLKSYIYFLRTPNSENNDQNNRRLTQERNTTSLFQVNAHSFIRKFRGQCGLLHHNGSTGVTWLGLEVHVRLQLLCDLI